jgi:hypothetical protein
MVANRALLPNSAGAAGSCCYFGSAAEIAAATYRKHSKNFRVLRRTAGAVCGGVYDLEFCSNSPLLAVMQGGDYSRAIPIHSTP